VPAKTQKPKSSRPVEARAKRTRDLILQAGIDSILGGGIQGFTANELMRRTGLSKGALFHHFDSLDDVAIECVSKGDRVLAVETRGSLRETLAYMIESTHGHRRMRALASLLYFYCEKARSEPRFKKSLQYLNQGRQARTIEVVQGFLPKTKPEVIVNAMRFLHIELMGLAGPAGDCLPAPERLKVWAQTVDCTLEMLQAK
jgi:AcrR family transcriptional regulator